MPTWTGVVLRIWPGPQVSRPLMVLRCLGRSWRTHSLLATLRHPEPSHSAPPGGSLVNMPLPLTLRAAALASTHRSSGSAVAHMPPYSSLNQLVGRGVHSSSQLPPVLLGLQAPPDTC